METNAHAAHAEATPLYRICTRCIMDTSDPGIEFDEHGVCNRCRTAEERRAASAMTPEQKADRLAAIVAEMKEEGRGRDYDCILGVSGGVDSTYAAVLLKQQGLRVLAVHFDNGWNTELAVSNIENCLRILDMDLYTYVVDWEEFRDLQLAFLIASTPDSEIPTDHAIFALLMRKAAELGVRFIANGLNLATEGVSSPEWSQGHTDWKYIQSIHRQFGKRPLKTYPHASVFDYAYFRYIKRQRHISILNYIQYDKPAALEYVMRELRYKPYEGKHHESLYTRFYQTYILPRKFGFDKRRWHLSDLILSGYLTRSEALEEISGDPASPEQLRLDKTFVAKKLGVSEEAFDQIMALPPRRYEDYPSFANTGYVRLARRVKRALLRESPFYST